MKDVIATNNQATKKMPVERKKTERATLPEMLVHFSTADISKFTGPKGRFKVNTQGRVYTLDINSKFANTSLAHNPQSALVFTHKALNHFHRHPWELMHFWKRPTAQYRTIKLGDITWLKKDTKLIDKNILQIRKVSRSTDNNKRIIWQKIKFAVVRATNYSFSLILLLLLLSYVSVTFDICIKKTRKAAAFLDSQLSNVLHLTAPRGSTRYEFFNYAKDHMLPLLTIENFWILTACSLTVCGLILIRTHLKTKKNIAIFISKLKTIKTR